MKSDWDAIVIGAGCAGLAAATRLAECGRKVVVLERRPILGGRASSFQDKETGETLDNGQHLFLGCYSETRNFLRRIGTENLLVFDRGFSTWLYGPEGQTARLKTSFMPAPLHLATGILKFRALNLRERWRTLKVARAAVASQNGYGGKSVSEWLKSLGQSSRSIERLWEPLTLATLNVSCERAPAELLAVVLRDGFLASREAAQVGLARVGLSDLHGIPSKNFLERRGGQVCTSASAERIQRIGPDRFDVTLAQGETHQGRALIVAVPPPATRRLLGTSEFGDLNGSLQATRKLKPSPIVSYHLWTRSSVLPHPFIGFWHHPIHWAFQKSEIFHDSSVRHISMVTSGAQEALERSRDENLIHCRDALKSLGRDSEIERAKIVIEKEATWVPPIDGRGPESGRLSAKTPYSNLFLAGDWTDTGLPCTIEGAVASGHRAAELTNSYLG